MSFHDPYAVYVKTNSNSYITDVDSSAFLRDTTGWEEIDRGYDDRFKYAQSYYFQQPIRTDGGAYRYKKVNGKVAECTPEEIAMQEAENATGPEQNDNSVWDELDAAYQSGYNEGYAEGVNGAYDQ